MFGLPSRERPRNLTSHRRDGSGFFRAAPIFGLPAVERRSDWWRPWV